MTDAAGPFGRLPRPAKVVLVASAVVVVVASLLVVAAAVFGVRVSGHSMEPTIADGERVLVLPGTGGEAGRFTVVVFRIRQESRSIVKRVIAVPGDRIAIASTAADPDDVRIQKRGSGPWYRVRAPSWAQRWRRPTSCCTPAGHSPGASPGLGGGLVEPGAGAVQTVPAGRFFYLGDNPDGSDDARKFGWAEIGKVQGRVSMGLWPLSELGGIGGAPSLTRVAAP